VCIQLEEREMRESGMRCDIVGVIFLNPIRILVAIEMIAKGAVARGAVTEAKLKSLCSCGVD
jgi:hypothetical protein